MIKALRTKISSHMKSAAVVLALASSLLAQTTGSKVDAVSGESWLHHLQRPFGETSMGKTGRLGPPAPALGNEPSNWQPRLSSDFAMQRPALRGADLYRLNCQGCHGESGQGAPPEINSVINPVRATSVLLVMERMKASGMEISRREAAQLAKQSRDALLQRLHNGGKDMPAFSQLSETEIGSLVSYLEQLAGVPGAEREQTTVRESPVRVGELIVKSTCHTCHSAAGTNPGPQQLLQGAIPPLSTLTTRTTELELVRKVTRGAPVMMGTPLAPYRGRMPVFYYLTPDEAADVYLYLTLYPPEGAAAEDQQGTGADQRKLVTVLSTENASPPKDPPDDGVELRAVAAIAGLSLFIVLLLAGGLGFTMHEFKRLSAESERHTLTKTPRWMPRVARSLGAMNEIPYSAFYQR